MAIARGLNCHDGSHLDQSQRAMVAARSKEFYAKEATERQKRSKGRGKKGPAPGPDLNDEEPGDARDKAGEAFGVSGGGDIMADDMRNLSNAILTGCSYTRCGRFTPVCTGFRRRPKSEENPLKHRVLGRIGWLPVSFHLHTVLEIRPLFSAYRLLNTAYYNNHRPKHRAGPKAKHPQHHQAAGLAAHSLNPR